jgi:hypothetical protein
MVAGGITIPAPSGTKLQRGLIPWLIVGKGIYYFPLRDQKNQGFLTIYLAAVEAYVEK